MLITNVIILIFMTFRNIGLDLEPHRVMFNSINPEILNADFFSNIFSNRVEPFFIILISIIKNLGMNFNVFLFITAMIPLVIVYKIIIKIETDRPLALYTLFILIYLLAGPINIIRHFVAISIYLSALYSISKGEKIKGYIKIIITLFIHYSNFILILILPFLNLKKININSKRYIIQVIFMLLISLVLGNITKKIFNSLDISSEHYIMWKIKYYLTEYDLYNYQSLFHKILLNTINYSLIIYNIAINISSINNIRIINKSEFSIILLKSQLLGSYIAILLCIIGSIQMAVRMNFMFGIGNFILTKINIFDVKSSNTHYKYGIVTVTLILINFITLLYYAGVHDSNSIFYLW